MPKKGKFSVEDEEKIIDFVKSNEILYNVKHKKFRDAVAKHRLWLKLEWKVCIFTLFTQLKYFHT